ncbi:hypothetical protein CAPTEDRAFT_194764, partial [Capitella teleta]
MKMSSMIYETDWWCGVVYSLDNGDKYTYNQEMLDAFLDPWISAIRKPGNVMFQCRRGYRAVVAAAVAVAFAYNKSSAWALDKALQADYFFEDGKSTAVVDFLTHYLPAAPVDDDERSEHK